MTSPLLPYSDFLTVTNLAPQLPVVGTPSVADPTTIDTTWTVQNTSGMALADVFLVFIKPVNYDPMDAGLTVPDDGTWKLFEVGVGEGELFYAGVSLGELSAGQSKSFSFTHLLATDLISTGSEPTVPQNTSGLPRNRSSNSSHPRP